MDESNIPTLEDIIVPGRSGGRGGGRETALPPDSESILQKIETQLKEELSALIRSTVEDAVAGAVANLEGVLRDELTHSLQRRAGALLEAALEARRVRSGDGGEP